MTDPAHPSSAATPATPADALERVYDTIALQQMLSPDQPVAPGTVTTIYAPVFAEAGQAMRQAAEREIERTGQPDLLDNLSAVIGPGFDAMAGIVGYELTAANAAVQILAQMLAAREGVTVEQLLRGILDRARGVV